MSTGQTAYLILVIAHFTIFGLGLLGACLWDWLGKDKAPAATVAPADLAKAA